MTNITLTSEIVQRWPDWTNDIRKESIDAYFKHKFVNHKDESRFKILFKYCLITLHVVMFAKVNRWLNLAV